MYLTISSPLLTTLPFTQRLFFALKGALPTSKRFDSNQLSPVYKTSSFFEGKTNTNPRPRLPPMNQKTNHLPWNYPKKTFKASPHPMNLPPSSTAPLPSQTAPLNTGPTETVKKHVEQIRSGTRTSIHSTGRSDHLRTSEWRTLLYSQSEMAQCGIHARLKSAPCISGFNDSPRPPLYYHFVSLDSPIKVGMLNDDSTPLTPPTTFSEKQSFATSLRSRASIRDPPSALLRPCSTTMLKIDGP